METIYDKFKEGLKKWGLKANPFGAPEVHPKEPLDYTDFEKCMTFLKTYLPHFYVAAYLYTHTTGSRDEYYRADWMKVETEFKNLMQFLSIPIPLIMLTKKRQWSIVVNNEEVIFDDVGVAKIRNWERMLSYTAGIVTVMRSMDFSSYKDADAKKKHMELQHEAAEAAELFYISVQWE